MTPPKMVKCQTCEGTGIVIVWRGRASATCDDCGGTGIAGGKAPSDDR